MNHPLNGVKVLDLSRLIAGNMLTMLLGDFGADVIKIEQPGVGDSLRAWRVDGRDLYWQVYGRNKRSVSLDLKSDLGRELFLRMVGEADLLVESFRPGALERMGLGWPALREANPRLVYLSVSGWGLTGSLAARPGFGTLVEANSGFAAANGFPDREPVLPPLALADMVAGIYGAYASTLALRHAHQTGEGQVIDLALFESLFSIMGPVAALYEATGDVPQRSGNRSPISAPRNIYATADGRWIALSATTQAMFERFATAIGRADMVEDPRFASNASRLANIDELDRIISNYFVGKPLDQLLSELDDAGVTATMVNDIGGLVDSEYFTTRGVLIRGPRSDAEPSGVAMHAVVPRLSVTPGSVTSAAPSLGQHNGDILRPLMTEAEWKEFLLTHQQRSTSQAVEADDSQVAGRPGVGQ